MARVQVEQIVDHLSSDMRPALEAAVQEVLPNAQFDDHAIFQAFRRAVRRRCSSWESVPDRYVEV
jgi:hypothetical protein